MSIKTTRRISRARAIELLLAEVPHMSNDELAKILDRIADSERGHFISRFDNFIVSEIPDEGCEV